MFSFCNLVKHLPLKCVYDSPSHISVFPLPPVDPGSLLMRLPISLCFHTLTFLFCLPLYLTIEWFHMMNRLYFTIYIWEFHVMNFDNIHAPSSIPPRPMLTSLPTWLKDFSSLFSSYPLPSFLPPLLLLLLLA